jgi:hypothetical protein
LRVKSQKIADQAIFYPAKSETRRIIGVFAVLVAQKFTTATGR